MSIPSGTARTQVTLTTTNQAISAGFFIIIETDILVTKTDPSTLADTVLVINTHYTVANEGTETNAVVTMIGGTVGDIITISRNAGLAQPLNLSPLGAFPSLSIEQGFDRAVQFAQQINETASRSFRVPITDLPPTGVELNKTSRKSKLLGFDSSGNVLFYSPTSAVLFSTGDQIEVNDLAALKAVSVTGLPTSKQAFVASHTTAGDGGDGIFRYDPASSTADDGGTVIQPNVGTGRWHRLYGSVVDLKWFGSGLGANNAISRAITALPNGGTILLAPLNVVTAVTTIPANNNSYIIQGNGVGGCFVRRDSTYPAGDIFIATQAAGTPKVTFKDFTIQNAEGFQNTSGFAFSINNVSTEEIVFDNVYVYNGNGGWFFSGNGNIHMVACVYLQSQAQIASGWGAQAGLQIQGLNTGLRCDGCIFATQATTSTSALENGIVMTSCDGANFVNCAVKAKVGVLVSASGSVQITNIFFSNCVLDECFISALTITGTTTGVYQNLRFDACHMVGYNRTTETDGVSIGGSAKAIQINGCNISGWRGNGVAISGGSRINISACSITDNDAADIGNFSIRLQDTTHVNISGNVAGAINQSPALANNNVFIASGCDGIVVVGNNWAPVQNQSVFLNAAVPNFVHRANTTGTSPFLTVASAATIDPLDYEHINLTGTTTVNTISQGWAGRVINFIIPGGVTFTGGNIQAAVVKAANSMAVAVFDPNTSKWNIL